MSMFVEKTCLGTMVFTAAFFAAMSCGMEEPETSASATHEKFAVSVSVPQPGTKVTDIPDEAAVNGLQVFVFREDGTLDAYASGSGASLTIECTSGERTFAAVANAPDLSDVMSMSELQAARSELSENSGSGFVMSGSAVRTVSKADETVEINVARLVARVSVMKLTNALSAPAYSDTDIKVKCMYLSNVAGDRQYLAAGTPVNWLNRLGTRTDIPELLYSGDLSFSISNGGNYDTAHHFYCYPNAVAEDSSAQEWSPRYTRLVIVTEIAGKTYYYPVSVSNIESNHLYEIENVRITRLGSMSPEFPVETGSVSIAIKVTDWETGSTTDVVI